MAKYKNSPIKVEENTLQRYLTRKCRMLKTRARKTRKAFDLTPDFLQAMYFMQNGKCIYTGVTLRLDSTETQPDSLSVDRIDPRKGYTISNVVLCTTFANSLKGTKSQEEFEILLRNTIKDISEYLNRS